MSTHGYERNYEDDNANGVKDLPAATPTVIEESLFFVAAERHRRFCLPNTRFMLHQPSGGSGGTASDIKIQAEQLRVMRERFHRIFSVATGQTEQRIAEDTNRDFWLTPAEALDYGLLGAVVQTVNELDSLAAN